MWLAYALLVIAAIVVVLVGAAIAVNDTQWLHERVARGVPRLRRKPAANPISTYPERRAIIFPISRKEQNNDLRDLLIAQQVRRIDELERQVDMLEALLHSGRRGQGIIFLASETRIGRAGLVRAIMTLADSDKENRARIMVRAMANRSYRRLA